jgi:LacI family transcriptional regulator
MATIKEIAERAGVSYATVSRALNGKPGVGDATRSRIEGLAREMGYTPDWQARALVTGRVRLFGLAVPDITNPFFPEMIRGAEDAVFQRGYNLLLQDTSWERSRLRQSLDLLTARRVAGLIVAAPVNGVWKEWEEMQRGRDGVTSRVVLAGQAPPRGSGLPAVEVDDRKGGLEGGRHLLGLGWERIAFLSGPRRERASRRRLSGLKRALAEVGREDALVAVSHGRWSVESGRYQTLALLEGANGSSRPDAFFGANDLLALGAVQALSGAGLLVGKDVGVVGYDDIGWSRYLGVPLTTVAQPKKEVGRRAAEMLLSAVESGERQGSQILEPELVVRGSCGSTASGE